MLGREGRFANRPCGGGDGAGRRGRVKSVQRTPLREWWVGAGSGWSTCCGGEPTPGEGLCPFPGDTSEDGPTGRQCNPRFWEVSGVAAQPLASEEDRELEGLVARRRQVIQMRTAEQLR